MNLLRSSLLALALALPLTAGCGPETPAGSEPTAAQLAEAVDRLNTSTHGAGKVEVCHVPPGNPERAHTIVVGAPALEAHLAHGDQVGTCEAPDAGGETPPPEDCASVGSSCSAEQPCCDGLTCSAEGSCTSEVIID
jgi:hypothetical protein